MLVIDFYTLKTIYTLYFTKHVILYGTHAFDLHDIVWVDTTFCQLVTGLKHLTIHNFDTGSVWNQVSFCLTIFFIGNDNFTFLLRITKSNFSAKFGNDSKTFWLSCLKKFLDTRKTLCDIVSGYTTGMECTHGKLCTRFTD